MPIESLVDNEALVWAAALLLTISILIPYIRRFTRRLRANEVRKLEAAELGIDRAVAQRPWIDSARCIGCGSCVDACPEGDVLGVVGGVATVINGLRCIGHSYCEEACPVEAIEVGLGEVRARSDMPILDDTLQTTVPGLYIAGELGGYALVRNAARQGRQVVESISSRIRREPEGLEGTLDLVIIGAGPAGLAAGFAARTAGLSFLVLERESDLGGTVSKYPRRKMVLTERMDFGTWGSLEEGEYQKEQLLEIFSDMVRKADLPIAFRRPVDSISRAGGRFAVRSRGSLYQSLFVVLALGRRGTPRRLGVPGEDLEKVMYRLIDAESYTGERILVVGGGDSAVEAAIGLARQPRNEVFISYRKPGFVRIKRKNQERIEAMIAEGRVKPVFSSTVSRILDDRVELRTAASEVVAIGNDYVFIFAGGVPPFRMLREMGILFGDEAGEALTPDPAPPGSTLLH